MIVIAVFVIFGLELPAAPAVAFDPVLPPAPPAPPILPVAADPLFWIVPPEIESVPDTNTLNHAVLYVAPADIVRFV